MLSQHGRALTRRTWIGAKRTNPADYIARVPSVQGGEPTIRGTRTPIRTIAVLFHCTYPGDLEAVQRALPHLTLDEIDAALAWYEANRDEVDAIIAEHERLFIELSSAR